MPKQYRPNPTLAIFGNPPSKKMHRRTVGSGHDITIKLTGAISHKAHSIAYEHVHNGKLYKHDFETNVSLLTGQTVDGKRVVIIVGDDDVYDDYPDEP